MVINILNELMDEHKFDSQMSCIAKIRPED